MTIPHLRLIAAGVSDRHALAATMGESLASADRAVAACRNAGWLEPGPAEIYRITTAGRRALRNDK